jgi:hypothetical protein
VRHKVFIKRNEKESQEIPLAKRIEEEKAKSGNCRTSRFLHKDFSFARENGIVREYRVKMFSNPWLNSITCIFALNSRKQAVKITFEMAKIFYELK